MLVSLSARLEALLALVEPCTVLADVGTDHGLIPVAAVQRGVAERAIAADLRALPLEVARRNVAMAGEQDRVLVVQGDGLLPLHELAIDAVVMAGVSGELMVRVLDAAPRVLSRLSQLVLQPNQDVHVVRAWARAHGFHLRDERMVEERGYFFPMCAFSRAQGADPLYQRAPFDAEELCVIGPLLLARKDATALRASEEQRARLAKLVSQGVVARADELAFWQRACAALGPD
ncbi:MAG: putative methyltransferase [Myxococcaceae bacterium]|nr:putative methyltransferase [Myxococcaceae bacterium]